MNKPKLHLLAVAGFAAASMALATRANADHAAGAAPAAGNAPAAAPQAPARVVEIDLNGTLSDRPHGFHLSLTDMGQSTNPAMSTLSRRLLHAAKDKSIAGVEMNLSDFSLSFTQAQELGQLIHKLRRAGKRVITYAGGYDTNTYLLASYGDTVVMPKHGDLFIPGVQLQLMFFKGLLNKLNLHADMIQIGKFKGAEEPLTRMKASKAFNGQVQNLVNVLYKEMVGMVHANRPQLTRAKVIKIINRAWLSGTRAKKVGLVDRLLTRAQTQRWIKGQFKGGVTFVRQYDEHKQAAPNFSNPFALFQFFGAQNQPRQSMKPAVAVIYADGVIMDNSAATDNNNAVVTPGRIARELHKAVADKRVRAIVLRIDSPGGSAAASDDIWNALRLANKKKPVTVSMGGEAASGGYYIACGGRSITADPGTITGSIGVVGGKVVIIGLLNKLGITVQTFQRGTHADLFSTVQQFSKAERAFVAKSMLKTYKQFTGRVMAARGKKIANIQKVARGRIWAGNAAVHAGLVDRLGTLHDVIAAAATHANIAKRYQVIIYPKARTLADVLKQRLASAAAPMPQPYAMALAAMPAAYRAETSAMLQEITALREDRTLLVLPAALVERP